MSIRTSLLALCFLGALGTSATRAAVPGDVGGLAVTASSPHAVTLDWDAYVGSDFGRYEVRRGTAPGVTLGDVLVGTISDSAVTTISDSGLVAYRNYYYRLFVVSPTDTASAGVEVNVRTEAINFPHTDTVGGTSLNFIPQEPWSLVENGPGEGNAHTGTWHWSDSPGGNYAPNTNAALSMTVNLGTAVMPVFTYWERYSFQANVDYGYVEVSRDGTNWVQVAFSTGSQTVWAEKRIDLTDWAGDGEVHIRFRAQTNGDTNSDGWHLDDFAIEETATATLPYPFADDVETDSTFNWITSSWSLVTDGHTPTHALHDSKTGNYPAYSRNRMVSVGVFDLSGATNPVLTFWHKYSLVSEHGYRNNEDDYGRVYVSRAYGQPGSYVRVASYSGTQPDWARVQIDLRPFAGSSTVRVKFQIEDYPDFDGGELRTADGWYIDDIRIEELPQNVSLDPITNSSMHHVVLNWTENLDPDFNRYEIYRATSENVSRSSALIATITDQAVTTFFDSVAMIQPTHYSYRIYVIDDLGDVSLGSEVRTAAYAIPENTFPFFDEMNAGTPKWASGQPWKADTTAFHSPPSSWADSPGASYGRNANTALATVVNLSGSTSPVLTFWHRYAFEEAVDFGLVEISTDGGQTWTNVLRVTGIDNEWTSERIDLGKYVGDQIGLRFRVTSDGQTQLDGWFIDDVAVLDESRSVAFPWSDGVESGVDSWFADSPWGLSDVNSHSGTLHWTDSPAGSYAPNENTSLRITIDLSESQVPVLRFWERYSFEPNVDWGYVEVSTDGGATWTQEYFVTGSQSTWRQDEIDLSPYRGNPQVSVRFRLTSNGSQQSDGWHLDDFEIADLARQLPYPFVESFDDTASAGNWLTSSWEAVSDGRSGPFRMHDSPVGNYAVGAFASLVLAGAIDLRGAVNPVLTFWQKYSLVSEHGYRNNEDDWGRVYVSPDDGQVWYLMGTWNGSAASWTKQTINLSQFVGASAVRVRFTLDDNPDLDGGEQRTAGGWWIDDVRIEELPVPVSISPITSSSQHHASIVWTENLDPDFDRYEIYRATNTTISRSSQLVKTITDQSVTAWTDTFAVVQPAHYSYGIYVIDTLENASLRSNVVTADYTVPVAGFPFADSMNADTPNWSSGHPWGPASTTFHSAPTSWKSGPGRAYPPNANTALATRVTLAGATAPIFTFWHRYAFETGVDFGRVEVSADSGRNWTEVLRVTGIDTTWSRERVDLGAYLGETIGIRFRVTSNGETQLDGWYIDDVKIEDGARNVAFPWTDDVESGVEAWFANSPWGLSDVNSHSGALHWTDSPAGSYAPNENTSLTITIDLSGAHAPALRFWERYSFEPNADWGFVEVSGNKGANWTQEYFLTGSSASWRPDEIDLSPYAGNPQVLIRFRLQSNGANESDGWHLDDFAITDVERALPYPFSDAFDDSSTRKNWLSASWDIVTDGRSGPFRMHDSPVGNYAVGAFASLVLAGAIDLRGAVNPVLTFWQKYSLVSEHGYRNNEDDWGRVYVSPDDGQVWYLMGTWNGSAASWTKQTINLSQFVGASAVRVRFTLDDNPDLDGGEQRTADGWWIDDVRIGEDFALQALADSVRLEGPAVLQAAPGLASPRLVGRVYEPDLTNVAGQGVNVVGQFGVGPRGTMPTDTTWTWFNGGYLNDANGFDRFFGSVRVDSVGTYSTAFRASIDGGATWVYGDLDGNNLAGGGISEFEPPKAGLLVVGLGGTVVLSDQSLRRLVRLDEQEIWSLGVGNDGPDPLEWKLMEATAESAVTDIPWLVIQQTSGVLSEGKRTRVDLTYDATGLAVDSTYSALLLLTSNDRDRDSVWIDAALTVLPTDVTGFTGWVALRGGGRVSGGTIVLYDAGDAAVDTVAIALNGWFAEYGLSAGKYRVAVTTPGAYPQELLNVELPAENVSIKVSPIHPLVQSPFSMEVYSEVSTLDGLPLPVGSVVTVRDPDGIVIGGYVVDAAGRYGLLHVYADDPNTPADEGARIGDELSFFVNDVRVNTTITYENHNVVRRVDLAANSVTPRHLDAGLHLISLAVAPRDTALRDILMPISGKYSYLSGFDQAWGGARTYVDTLQEFSDLHTLDGYHGYWLRMDEPGDLVVYGSRLHDDVPIPMKEGWNLISYLPATPFSPDRALAGIYHLITTAGGFDAGAQTYVPGSPLSDLAEMKPGFGYWLHLSAPAILNYRTGESASPPAAKAAAPQVVQSPEGQAGQPIPTREWMDLYGALTVDGRPVRAGTVVSIADESGVVCGATVVRTEGKYGFLHTYADDPLTEVDEGAAPGESLALLINGKRAYGARMVVWQGGQAVVRADLDASLIPTNVGAIRPLRFGMDEPRPNPFNPSTVLSYELTTDGPTRVVVYDQLGRRVRTLVDENVSAGRHMITWRGADEVGRAVASGVYFVRLSSPEGTITRRLVLLR